MVKRTLQICLVQFAFGTKCNTNSTNSPVAVERLACLPHLPEVLGSNLDPTVGYFIKAFVRFPHFFRVNAGKEP
jgi:hypothetical protein